MWNEQSISCKLGGEDLQAHGGSLQEELTGDNVGASVPPTTHRKEKVPVKRLSPPTNRCCSRECPGITKKIVHILESCG